MSRYSIQGPHYPFAISPLTGADPGFEKGRGVETWDKIFWHISANLGEFLMKLAQKWMGVRPPVDPPLIKYKRIDFVIRY